MKIIKHIPIEAEDANLVAFITGGIKPYVYICYDGVFNEEHDYESSIKSAADIDNTNQIGEYLLMIPLSEIRKISKVKIKV